MSDEQMEEPTGDVVVIDALAESWIYDDETEMWFNDYSPSSPLVWHALLDEFDTPPRVYRAERSNP